MAKTTKSKRPDNVARFQTVGIKAPVKPTKSTKSATSSSTKTKKLTPQKRPVQVPLAASVSSSIDPVRFGSVGENAYIYLREGVENLVDELQVSIAAKELAKKNALKVLEEFEDLPSTCTMSEIRIRLNTVVGALIDVFHAM